MTEEEVADRNRVDRFSHHLIDELISVLESRTPQPNIGKYEDGMIWMEARLNKQEQLFVEITADDQVDAVIYTDGTGALPIEVNSVKDLLEIILKHLDRL